MLLYAYCMIMNDISSDSSAFLNVKKLIACLIFFLITLDYFTLSFNSNSSLIWIFEDNEYIAFRNILHFSLNSIFNSFCKFCIKDRFLIKRDLVNLYVWNTSFSSKLFKKLIQNWFLISFIASWYEFRICTIFAHASSFLHLFQIRFFDNNVFCISMSSLFHQNFDFAHIRCLNTNNFTVFLMYSVKYMTFASKLMILCILTIILSFDFCKCSLKSFQLTFCKLYDAFNEFSTHFIFFVTIVNRITLWLNSVFTFLFISKTITTHAS